MYLTSWASLVLMGLQAGLRLNRDRYPTDGYPISVTTIAGLSGNFLLALKVGGLRMSKYFRCTTRGIFGRMSGRFWRTSDVRRSMSSVPTYGKSPWTPKVNSFLFDNLYTLSVYGILLEHRPLFIDRLDISSTDVKGEAEEAQELKLSKAYAWTRRRKRQDKEKAVEAARPAQPAGPSGASLSNSQTPDTCRNTPVTIWRLSVTFAGPSDKRRKTIRRLEMTCV